MKQLKKIFFIYKSIGKQKSNSIILALAGIVLGFTLLSLTFIFQIDMEKAVKNATNKYGTYAFGLESTENGIEEKLESISNVKDLLRGSRTYYNSEGINHILYYGDQKLADMVGFSLVKGHFPENENEIVVDSNYVQDYKMNINECIGKSIEIQSDE